MALLDHCPHRGAALSQGRMTALGNLQCAYHVRSSPVAHSAQCWPVVGAGCASFTALRKLCTMKLYLEHRAGLFTFRV